MDGYMKMFERLAERAHQHGICSAVVLSTEDPMTGYSTHRAAFRGNYYQNLGAVNKALKLWEGQ